MMTNYKSVSLAVVVGLLSCVLCLELAARVDDFVSWDAPVIGPYNAKILTTVDSEVGARCKPGAKFEKWQIDDQGFRRVASGTPSNDDAKEIVVIGASEAFGLYESPGGEFPSELSRILSSSNPGQFNVLNAACPGLSLPRLIPLIERWLADRAPFALVIYPTPHFYLDEYLPREEARAPQVSLTDRIRLVGKLKNALKKFVPITLQSKIKQLQLDNYVSRSPEGHIWDEVPEERLQRFRDDISSVAAIAQRHSDHVILMTHANRFGEVMTPEDERQAINWMKFYPRASIDVLIAMDRRANEYVKELSVAEGFKLVDAAKVTANQEGSLFADFSHFNDRGSEVVARELATAVRSFD